MTEPIEKPCTNLELLSRQAERSGKFWFQIRTWLVEGKDFSILCPNMKRAKEITEVIRKLIVEMNELTGLKSKSKVKVTHPFEKKTGQFPIDYYEDDLW